MIKKGTLCVWQNCKEIKAAVNGTECVALSDLGYLLATHGPGTKAVPTLCYLTDTIFKRPSDGVMVQLAANPHELREKKPPPDEFVDEEETFLTKVKENHD